MVRTPGSGAGATSARAPSGGGPARRASRQTAAAGGTRPVVTIVGLRVPQVACLYLALPSDSPLLNPSTHNPCPHRSIHSDHLLPSNHIPWSAGDLRPIAAVKDYACQLDDEVQSRH